MNWIKYTRGNYLLTVVYISRLASVILSSELFLYHHYKPLRQPQQYNSIYQALYISCHTIINHFIIDTDINFVQVLKT